MSKPKPMNRLKYLGVLIIGLITCDYAFNMKNTMALSFNSIPIEHRFIYSDLPEKQSKWLRTEITRYSNRHQMPLDEVFFNLYCSLFHLGAGLDKSAKDLLVEEMANKIVTMEGFRCSEEDWKAKEEEVDKMSDQDILLSTQKEKITKVQVYSLSPDISRVIFKLFSSRMFPLHKSFYLGSLLTSSGQIFSDNYTSCAMPVLCDVIQARFFNTIIPQTTSRITELYSKLKPVGMFTEKGYLTLTPHTRHDTVRCNSFINTTAARLHNSFSFCVNSIIENMPVEVADEELILMGTMYMAQDKTLYPFNSTSRIIQSDMDKNIIKELINCVPEKKFIQPKFFAATNFGIVLIKTEETEDIEPRRVVVAMRMAEKEKEMSIPIGGYRFIPPLAGIIPFEEAIEFYLRVNPDPGIIKKVYDYPSKTMWILKILKAKNYDANMYTGSSLLAYNLMPYCIS